MNTTIHHLWKRCTISFLNKSYIRNTILQHKKINHCQPYTTTTATWIDTLLDKEKKNAITFSSKSPPLYQQNNNISKNVVLLAQFYRSLKTQDMDKIWPFYTTLYQHDLHKKLTRNNYKQLLQLSARQTPSQKHLSRLLTILEDMQHQGHKMRLSEYNQIITWVGGKTVPITKQKHVTEALDWFRLMEQDHIQPCLVTFNTLIHITSQAKDILTAQRLYHAMLAKGIEADQFTYTTLINSMAIIGDTQGVYDMVSRLKEKGQHSFLNNIIAWNTLLSCYYDASLNQKGKLDLEKIQKEDEDDHGGGDDDDIYNKEKEDRYSFFIDFEKVANDMYHDMIDATLSTSSAPSTTTVPKADSITFQIHIDYLLKQGKRDQAIHVLLDTMPHLNIQPTITIYNHLFASFMNPPEHIEEENTKKLENKSQIHELYHSLTTHHPHINLNSTTLYTLINALLDAGDTSFALETFVQICQQHNLSPCDELLERLQHILASSQDNT